MPVVTFGHQDLVDLIGHDYSVEELATRMPMMGGDLDKYTESDITIEWFPDRPDLLTLEGTGRAMRAFLGHDSGLPSYPVAPPTTTLHVDKSVQAVRPYAALCFVRGVNFDDQYVKTVMEAQEKLCLAPGRRRRKIAIGVHDARGIVGPFTYTVIKPNEKPFAPLGHTQPWTPGKILAEHAKGKEYGHLIDEIPVFLDGNGEVISMPPIINAQRTAVTSSTADVLIDVTGSDEMSVKRTIALLATGFAERGGSIEAVTVHDASGEWQCPLLEETETVLHQDDVVAGLGLPLTGDDIATALQKMGHGAESFDNKILVRSPMWRFDLLHAVDWLEDIAIGYGFEHFDGTMPTSMSVGKPLPTALISQRIDTVMLGLGWSQAQTLSLSNPDQQWGHWGEAPTATAQLHNPVLDDQTLLRMRMAPSLLHVLAKNRHRALPQRLFEAGYVQRDGHNLLQLGAVALGAKMSFNDAKALAQAILRDAVAGEIASADIPGTIPGRAGAMMVDGKQVGWFGELHPDVITRFGLGAATIALELDLE